MTIGPGAILSFVLIAFSIILHEIAHGYAALKFGDSTAERAGRLTLNPMSHIDPVGTVVFPLLQLVATGHVFLGWAKPVPVSTHDLEPRIAGEIVVSIAGVAVNFAIAIAMAFLLGLEHVLPRDSPLFDVVLTVLAANVGLMVFNLLPIPPLDGSHVFKYLLPSALREGYERIGFYGTILLLLLSSQGLLRPITGPTIGSLINFLLRHISEPLRGGA